MCQGVLSLVRFRKVHEKNAAWTLFLCKTKSTRRLEMAERSEPPHISHLGSPGSQRDLLLVPARPLSAIICPWSGSIIYPWSGSIIYPWSGYSVSFSNGGPGQMQWSLDVSTRGRCFFIHPLFLNASLLPSIPGTEMNIPVEGNKLPSAYEAGWTWRPPRFPWALPMHRRALRKRVLLSTDTRDRQAGSPGRFNSQRSWWWLTLGGDGASPRNRIPESSLLEMPFHGSRKARQEKANWMKREN